MKKSNLLNKARIIVEDYFATIPSSISIKNYRFYLVAHVAFNFAFTVHFLWLWFFLIISVIPLFIFNIFSVILFTLCILINRRGHHLFTTVVGMVEVVAHQIFASYLLGTKSGYPLYILVVSLFPFLMPAWRIWVKIVLFVMTIFGYLFIEFWIESNSPLFQLNDSLLTILNVSNIFFAFVCLGIWGTYFNYAVYKTEGQLEEEHKRTEQLNLSISILEKVKLQDEMKQKETDLRTEFKNNLHDDVNSEISAIKGNGELILLQGRKMDEEQLIKIIKRITESCGKILLNTDILIRENRANADSADQLFEDMLSYAEFSLPNIHIEKGNLLNVKTNRSIPISLRKNYFLIFKECLNNISKHAECTEVIVNWGIKENCLFLEIEDNGKGFDTTKNYKGNGLKNFITRAESINGKIFMFSIPGRGTRVCLEVLLP